MANRLGEPTLIDQKTLEIKGTTSGKVYGKGTTMAEALALQNQVQVGGTPTVSGRPDMYAIAPTAADKTQPFTDTASGAQITPTTATPGQLAQAGERTLPSFRASTGATYLDGPTFESLKGTLTEADLVRDNGRISLKPGLTIEAIKARGAAGAAPAAPTAPEAPVAPPSAPTTFDQAMRDATTGGAKAGMDKALGASDSYDTLLDKQKLSLMTAYLGDAVTPESLRWLSPAQQSAVRSGKKDAIEAALAGINSIVVGRKEKKDADQARIDKQNAETSAKAETTFNLYSKYNLWDKLSEEDKKNLEVSLGLPSGTINSMATMSTTAGQEWKMGTDPNGNDVLYTFDPTVGPSSYQSVVVGTKAGKVSGGGGGGSGGGGSSVDKTETAFRKDAFDLMKGFDPSTGSIDQLVASLRAKYPMLTAQTIRGILTDTQIPTPSAGLNASDIIAGVQSGGLSTN